MMKWMMVLTAVLALPGSEARWSIEGTTAHGSLGQKVAPAGDVNGDGFEDVLVWRRFFPDAGDYNISVGRVEAYLGRAGGLALTPDWSAESPQLSDGFGSDFGPAGDVNGDGFADIYITAPYHDLVEGTPTSTGIVYVHAGTPQGLTPSPQWTLAGSQPIGYFGESAAGIGDVNGDGYDDLAVGSNLHDSSIYALNDGAIFVHHGGPEGLAATESWSVVGEVAGAWLGASVAGAGDVNGDGYADLVAGAPYYKVKIGLSWIPAGAVFLYRGGAAGLEAPATAMKWVGSANDDRMGRWVSGAGDVNGDGLADLAYLKAGIAVLRFGKDGLLDGLWSVGAAELGVEPSVIAAAGDVTLDGIDDLLVGADGAFLYSGGAGGPAAAPDWQVAGVPGESYGRSLAGVGDVNGDGGRDILVGAPGRSTDLPNVGAAHLFHGPAPLTPPPASLDQLLADASASVPEGAEIDTRDFVVTAYVETAAPRQAGIEVEVKEMGVDFDGTGTVLSLLREGAGPVSVVIQDRIPGTGYRWRARLITQVGTQSAWIEFGSADGEVDIRIEMPVDPPSSAGRSGSRGKGSCLQSAAPGGIAALGIALLLLAGRRPVTSPAGRA